MVAFATCVALTVSSLGASAQAPGGGGTPDPEAVATITHEADAARHQYDLSLQRITDARARLTQLEWEAASIEVERGSLDAGQQQLSRDLEVARVRAHEAIVTAYIDGRPADLTAAILSTESPADYAFRSEILTRHIQSREATIKEYTDMAALLDSEAAKLAERAALNVMAREDVAREIAAAEEESIEAERILTVIDSQVQLQVAGGRFVAAGSDGSPTPAESGYAFGLGWDLLRRCESGGNYAAVSATGRFRGAYQFHQTTWEMLGGLGDPVLAPTAEQDYRAQVLYDMLGSKPWPQCGRYLDMTQDELEAIVSGRKVAGEPAVPAVVPLPDPSSTTSTSSTSSTIVDGSTSSTVGSTTSTSEPRTPTG